MTLIDFIAAIAPIVVACIGAYSANKATNARRKYHVDQNSLIYEPLMAFFLFQKIDSEKINDYKNELNKHEKKGQKPKLKISLTSEEVEEISKLLKQYSSLAVPQILDAWRDVCNQSQPDYTDFYLILESNYHWVRRCLGYSFADEKIVLDHLPNKKSNINSILSLVFLLFGLFFYLAYLLPVLFQIENPRITIIGWSIILTFASLVGVAILPQIKYLNKN